MGFDIRHRRGSNRYAGGRFDRVDPAITPPSLFVMIASLALSVRRLHDIDRSGWWVMIPLTIIGIFILICWFCKRGEEGENRFGADPLGSEPASTMEG